MEKKALYIPVNIRREKEIVDGFGKKELIKTGFVIFVGIIIGGIIAVIKQQNFWFMISPFFAGILGISLFRKSIITNKSFADFFIDFIRFKKSKKSYYYKYQNIYEGRLRK